MKKLITTEKTEFEQNLKDLALIETDDRAGEPTMISSADLNEGFTNADSDVKELLSFDVEGEEITVTPTTSDQVKTPSSGKNAITKVTVKAAPLETASATPTTSEQTIEATTAGKIGLSSVTVGAVTSDIDANIVAGNIKDGVTILGVAGNYVKPEDANLIPENIKHGVTIYGVEGTYTGDQENL